MKLILPALLATCVMFSVAGCSGTDAGAEAETANKEILKQNPSDIPPVSEEDASGDASMMGGPKKGGG